ncbi:MAG: hypothetical protein ACTSVE_08325 [Candidatus Helarchaeota archaeon]
MPVTNAAHDDYGVNIGDEVTWEVVQDNLYSQQVGTQYKINITAINMSYQSGYYAKTMSGIFYTRPNPGGSWTQASVEITLSLYNPSNGSLNSLTGGFGMGPENIVYWNQMGMIFSTENLTAVKIYFEKGWPNQGYFNNTDLTGYVLTVWNGTTSGDGLVVGSDQKYVMTFDPTKLTTSLFRIYNWTSSGWQKYVEVKMGGSSQTTSPPIPGFETVFILIALSSAMFFYFWKKIRINYKS